MFLQWPRSVLNPAAFGGSSPNQTVRNFIIILNKSNEESNNVEHLFLKTRPAGVIISQFVPKTVLVRPPTLPKTVYFGNMTIIDFNFKTMKSELIGISEYLGIS